MRGSDLFSGSTTASANFTAGRPAGTINGVNSSFSIPQAPRYALLFRNGVLQLSPDDYSLSGTTITYKPGSVPQSGDSLFYVSSEPKNTSEGKLWSHLLVRPHCQRTPGLFGAMGLIWFIGSRQSILPIPIREKRTSWSVTSTFCLPSSNSALNAASRS